MQLTAKLVQLQPLQTGTGRNGEWKKQEIIVETDGQYPKKVCISIWGDKINPSILEIGNILDISFDIESREFNGRWYTDVKAWKVDLAGTNQSNQAPNFNEGAFPPPPPAEPISFGNDSDDLPF